MIASIGRPAALLAQVLVMAGLGQAATGDEVDFDRQVRPILAAKCFSCHGPDKEAREADLRLDLAGSALAKLPSGQRAIVPGQPKKSALLDRITSRDPDRRMPPAGEAGPLKADEIDLIRRWVKGGAKWTTHWSFRAPRRPLPPRVRGRDWVRNPIDRFVLARLERSGLKPSASADRRTLIRRASLDLRGLPPSPAEVKQFLADRRQQAYRRLIDRLIASPRYGERMAIEWLDAARFADTHGYLFDTARPMHRWRDWVIQAFNRNMPFDRFTIEQLAGDLLPKPRLSQRIATGFHRNHIINNEAGANAQEYLVENVVDRVNTTATVWLGLTVGCCQCHDHKYDPLTQKDFYQLFAFFNTIDEVGLDGLNTNAKPFVAAPTSAENMAIKRAERELAQSKAAMARLEPQIARDQRKWEASQPAPPSLPKGLKGHWTFDGSAREMANDKIKEARFEGDKAEYQPGVIGESAIFKGLAYLDAGSVLPIRADSKFTFAVWVRPQKSLGRFSVISKMLKADKSFRGYTMQVVNGLPNLFLINSFPDNMIQVQGKKKLPVDRWSHLAVTYDGSGKAKGIQLFVDGKPQKKGLTVDKLNGPITADSPFWIGNGHPAAKWQGGLDDVRVYERPLGAKEINRLPGLSMESIIASKERSAPQERRLREHFLSKHAPPEWRKMYDGVQKLAGKVAARRKAVATVMVLKEMKKPRATSMLIRGAFNQPGKKVRADTPSRLPPMSKEQPRNRLGLARWLVDGRNPLTSRVTVNRFWQMYFGTGLVKTAEDFGIQGERPSHPQLLDWLADEFVASGWDVKHLQRLIVTSATYRQSSAAGASSFAKDPENRILSRGPRQRLSAELIRDQALAASGLLSSRIGGPSVRPYQPAGLWREVAFDFSGAALTAQIYRPDKGADLFRRSIYTFWKRTSPPPAMLLLDAPDRERCVVRRQRTNTPLQALLMMNDITFVEASRLLAERMNRADADSPAAQIELAFQVLLSRPPRADELQAVLRLYNQQAERFRRQPKLAARLLSVGSVAADKTLVAEQVAAAAVVASVLLNLDETMTNR